jgi:inorganic pyrophosphatase/exopolyphosphatase
MAKTKYIFVDLDETLIHCDPWNDEPREGSKVIKIDHNDTYRAVLRPGALDLLKTLREIAPCYILTAATQGYAEGWNRVFKLGFKNSQIYHRDDIHIRGGIELSGFPNAQSYLIDNLPRRDNMSKIEFLNLIDPIPKYFNIKPYYGYEAQDLTVKMIQEIVDFIND